MPPKRSRSPEKQEKLSSKKAKKGETTRKSVTGKAKSQSTIRKKKDNAGSSSKKKSTPATESKQKKQKGKMSIPVQTGSWLAGLITDEKWKERLGPSLQDPTIPKFREMVEFVEHEYKTQTVFPPKELIFNAFNKTPFDKVKVVILGQDPYHDDGQAQGLSFSVPRGVKIPPSLRNIYRELSTDIAGFTAPDHGCLEVWAERGVLLLNAALTVRAHEPNSHARCGWSQFTDYVMMTLSDQSEPLVFLLWGGFAHKKEKLLDTTRHKIIKTAHPSPLSFNKFRDCKCFSQVDSALVELGREPMDWTLD